MALLPLLASVLAAAVLLRPAAADNTTLTLLHYDLGPSNSSLASTAGLMRALHQALLAYPAALLLNPTGHRGKRLWIQHDASAPNLADIVSRRAADEPRAAGLDPLLAANVRVPGSAHVRGSTVLSAAGGLRVGVVGFVSARLQSSPAAAALGVHVSDAVEAVRREARRLRGNGVPLVLGLGNAGFPEDQLVATRVAELDAVVAAAGGGDGYPLAVRRADGRPVPLLQAPPSSVCLTQLVLDADHRLVDWGGVRVPIADRDDPQEV